jgi:hypothetical protein
MEKRDLYYCPIFEYDKNAKKNVVSAVFGAERTAKGIVQYLYDVEEGEDIFREEKNMPWPLSMKEFVEFILRSCLPSFSIL